jgi:hypothetical protein
MVLSAGGLRFESGFVHAFWFELSSITISGLSAVVTLTFAKELPNMAVIAEKDEAGRVFYTAVGNDLQAQQVQ